MRICLSAYARAKHTPPKEAGGELLSAACVCVWHALRDRRSQHGHRAHTLSFFFFCMIVAAHLIDHNSNTLLVVVYYVCIHFVKLYALRDDMPVFCFCCCCCVLTTRSDSFAHAQKEGEIDCRLLVHQSLAGCVIGKGGHKIKEVRDVSSAESRPPDTTH